MSAIPIRPDLADDDSSDHESAPTPYGEGSAGGGVSVLSELHLADEFLKRHGQQWRFVKEWGAWYEWRGDGWYEDTTGRMRGHVVELVREATTWRESKGLTAPQRRKLCTSGTMTGIASIVGSMPEVSVTAERWNADPMILGVPGGSIDLRTGEFRAPEQEHYLARRCAIAPRKGRPSLWLSHLEMVLRGDQDAISFMQRFLGYMLTGQIGEHALLFLYGQGRNGKGTLVETVIRIMGDYGYSAPVNLVMESRQERHPVELAMLRGKRAVSCSEPPQGSKWDDGRIRSLTGGDSITARKMNQDFSTFLPTHKLIMMGNHKPALRSVDEAIRARFNIIDFSYTIPAEDRDPHFLDRLKAEWPYILDWMIEGCIHWQEDGLRRPVSMVESTAEYLQDEDVMGQFLTECCDRTDGTELLSVLFKAYEGWCEKAGEHALPRRRFFAALHDTPGVERVKGQTLVVGGLKVKQALVEAPAVSGYRSWMQD